MTINFTSIIILFIFNKGSQIWYDGFNKKYCALGKSSYGVDPPFAGSMDDLMIFNRALSAAEVNYLYSLWESILRIHKLKNKKCVKTLNYFIFKFIFLFLIKFNKIFKQFAL